MFTPKIKNTTYLSLSWSVSKGRDTYGYNICHLVDEATGKRYKTCGGGYDMVGAVLGDWLEDVMQDELKAIAEQAYYRHNHPEGLRHNDAGLYGTYAHYNKEGALESVSIDGACGVSSVIKIAEALGLRVEDDSQHKKGKGFVTVGFIVSKME